MVNYLVEIDGYKTAKYLYTHKIGDIECVRVRWTNFKKHRFIRGYEKEKQDFHEKDIPTSMVVRIHRVPFKLEKKITDWLNKLFQKTTYKKKRKGYLIRIKKYYDKWEAHIYNKEDVSVFAMSLNSKANAIAYCKYFIKNIT